MSVSKAYLRRLTRVVRDRETRAAIREFLLKYGDEINTSKLVITGTGDVFYEGSIGKYTFYKKWGKYYKRKKSSLTIKRFRKDKAFKGSRESAERFALGNQLASKLYKMVAPEKKMYELFCDLKRKAIALIKEGKTVDEATDVLLCHLRSIKLLKQEGEKSSFNANAPARSNTHEKHESNHVHPSSVYIEIFLPSVKARAG